MESTNLQNESGRRWRYKEEEEINPTSPSCRNLGKNHDETMNTK